MRGLERRRLQTVDRLGADFAAGLLSSDSLEFRVGQALGASSSAGLRLARWGLPEGGSVVARVRAIADELRAASCALHIPGRPDLLLTPSAERQTWTLGRSRTNDVRLARASVSRRHARVAFRGGCWTVEDLDSSNGTYLNGTRISRHALRPGDRVQFAEVTASLVRQR